MAAMTANTLRGESGAEVGRRLTPGVEDRTVTWEDSLAGDGGFFADRPAEDAGFADDAGCAAVAESAGGRAGSSPDKAAAASGAEVFEPLSSIGCAANLV